MLNHFKRIIAVAGHYGSGKTNFAVNLALYYHRAGHDTALVDLDIVNPYFRSADFAEQLELVGIETVVPLYARSNLDIPALTARVDAAIETEKTLIIDVGGDDAGAAALGRYSKLIEQAGGCELLYVVNRYRYLTQTAGEADEILSDIEAVSHLKATGVVNNSNLGEITTAQHVADSMEYARETAQKRGIPLVLTTCDQQISEQVKLLLPEVPVWGIEMFVKKPWEE